MTGKQLRKMVKAERRIRQKRVLRQSSPWLVAGAVAAASVVARVDLSASGAGAKRSATAVDEQPVHRLDIPAGSLGDVLAAFERLTGVHVEVPVEAMKVIYSPGATGALTDRQALQQILEGTSITYRFSSEVTALLEFRTVAESISVTATAPVVASPKFTAPLRDVPQTINVLKADLLAQQGAVTLRDALRNVTGITFQAGEGGTPAGDQMTIRGFSARTDMFVDGVRDTGGYSRDTFNLEQVEVAKGPASAISGRGSTGGSINMISKTPRLNESYAGTVEGGTANYKRATIDINHPINGLDGAAFRINALVHDAGVPGRDEARDSRWAVAPTVEFGLRTPTRFTLSYLHMAQDNVPDYGQPWVPATNLALAEFANGRPPVDRSNYYGLRARDFETIDNDIATAQIAHSFQSGLNVTNVTRFGNTYRNSVLTSPRFTTNINSTDIRRTDVKWRDQNDDILANQTNATLHAATGRIQHDLVGGIEFSKEQSKNFVGAETGPGTPISPDTDLYTPDPSQPYTGTMGRTGAYTDGVAASQGAYLFDTASLGAKVQLTGGLRWDRFDVDYDSVTAAGVHAPLSRTDSAVSGRLGVVYKPEAIGSIYAGYASSFNPSAEGLALTTATVNLEPEKTQTYEVGSKWDVMAERLGLNAAYFRTEKTNARTPGINPGDPPTVLAGKQIVQGIEVGLSGQITPKWSGFAAYSFMRSQIAASNTAAELDQSLALTPENTFNFWTTYDVWRTVKVGGGAQFMDAVFRNAINTIRVPSYWVANALVEYTVNEHLTLRLNGNNLNNADYVDRLSGGHFVPGSARSLMLSSSVGF